MNVRYDFQPRDLNRDVRVERPDLTEAEQFARWEAELPPSSAWLINPAKMQYETPTDERGLVDIKTMVAIGKAAVAPGYVWDLRRTRDDHLYWSETAYQRLAYKLDDPLPVVFRNIPPNILRLPLQFERWKHAITVPPDFPELDVMDYQVQAWATARDLYMSVREAVKWERLQRNRAAMLLDPTRKTSSKEPEDVIGQEFIAETLAVHFKGAAMSLEAHARIPQEFRWVDPSDNAREILRVIGYQVKHGCRDGIRSRQSMFKPHDISLPQAA